MKAIIVGVLAVLIMAGLLAIEKALWNWLCPMLFHLPTVTFWQMAGLDLLVGLVTGHTENSIKEELQ